jgi:Mg2+ and Co2+ transporter CorA
MISKYNHKGLTWIDLESPTEEEISHIFEQLYIPENIIEKINNNKGEDVVEINDHFTIASIKDELRFIIHNNFILTIHKTPIPAFVNFGKEMELDLIIEEKSIIKNNGLLLAHLLKNLYLDLKNQSTFNDDVVKNLKRKIKKSNDSLKLFIFLSIIFLLINIISIWL